MRVIKTCGTNMLTKRQVNLFVLVSALVILCSVVFTLPVLAVKDPIETIKPILADLTKILNDPALQGDAHRDERRQKIMSTIKTVFDFREMARRVLGITWQQIGESDRKHFTEVMTKLLENIYIGRFENYHYKRIEYLGEKIQGNQAQVSTQVDKQNVQLPVYYLLQLTPKGWMVYDINIEGVSLVSNYAEQFRSILRTNSFQGLVKIIEEKNRMLEKTNDN